MSQQGKRKTKSLLDFYTSQKNRKISCVLYAHSQFLCSLARFDLANWSVRQPVQPHTFYAPLLVFNERSAQLDFAVVNCADAVISVCLNPCFNVQTDVFAIMNCCVVALSLFSSDIVTWSADSLYSVQWHINWGECVQKNMHSVSTNFSKKLVGKHEYNLKLWRNK